MFGGPPIGRTYLPPAFDTAFFRYVSLNGLAYHICNVVKAEDVIGDRELQAVQRYIVDVQRLGDKLIKMLLASDGRP